MHMWNLFRRRTRNADARLAHIRLVSCDLDGTLLTNEGDLFDSTVQLIALLRSHGLQFVLNTGRSATSVLEIHELLNLKAPCIAFDGALICDADGSALQQWSIDLAAREKLRMYTANIDVSISTIGAFEYQNFGQLYAPDHILHEKIAVRSVSDKTQVFDTEALRYYFVASKADIESLESQIAQDKLLSSYAKSSRESKRLPGRSILELRRADVDKGTALRWLQQHSSVHDSSIAVIGDYRNDLPMFRKSYYCVTLSNAVAELRSRADFVCSESADDGGIDEFFTVLLNLHQ